ncbi:hypothetical protein M885DRAFT_547000 [Pelagophyceae sp. CCMP2097]|nr:hypothetical protein M885DRAFT_547000 [Pelagophyceae sp. CCMP2097]|mmetsp:Transcript_17725/g.60856  ORF Transcript_17725/g.60856 Transcript_17725/m.60856 type:complete len:304 (-) Transcript_17725:281-1192(-)
MARHAILWAGVRRLRPAGSINGARFSGTVSDAALNVWARANADAARALLQPPAYSAGASPDLTSLQAFLDARQWHVPDSDEARALVTQALTYPLTLAAHARELGLVDEACIVVVGARAEASLPTPLWAELLVAVPSVRRWHVHFVGPDVSPGRRDGRVAARYGGSTLRLSAERVTVEAPADLDVPAAADGDSPAGPRRRPDAIVLYNPGVGHHKLEAGWRRGIAAVRASRLPLLLTSHSALDERRDLDALAACLGGAAVPFAVRPHDNVFRSRKTFSDPEILRHVTAANARACVVAAAAPWLL